MNDETWYKEIQAYLRTLIQTYVAWFTFFVTVLLGAVAWGLKASLNERGEVVISQPIYAIVALFIAECILGLVATFFVFRDCRRLEKISKVALKKKESPVPFSFPGALVLMGLALVTNIIFLFYIAYFVHYLPHH